MGKSFLERLARGLGKSTGKLVEKAKEHGLDKKAEELAQKAQVKFRDLQKRYAEGQVEAKTGQEPTDQDEPGGEPDGEPHGEDPGNGHEERGPSDRNTRGAEPDDVARPVEKSGDDRDARESKEAQSS